MAASTYCLTFFFSDHSVAQVIFSFLRVDVLNFLLCFVSKLQSNDKFAFPLCFVLIVQICHPECNSLYTFLHRVNSDAHLFHYGTYSNHKKCKYFSQGQIQFNLIYLLITLCI